MLAVRYDLGDLEPAVDEACAALAEADAVGRLWSEDYTLFAEDPIECANRMGWLAAPEGSHQQWAGLVAAAGAIAADTDHVVLMGMGGSSLFAEVLSEVFGSAPGFPRLHVIDSTHPDAIRRVAGECPPDRTFHLASSKSGSTVETRSHLAWFLDRSGDPSRFGVVTDPGSALFADATEAGFAHVWVADPDIGGRYSAMSLFGMVPAALIGADGDALLTAALEQSDALEPLGDDDSLNVGVRLGAAIAVAARAGRDKLTFRLDPRIAPFGAWVEQLVAESLGKHGLGVVPVVGEPDAIAGTAPDDRLVIAIGDVAPTPGPVPVISIPLEEATDLGALVQLWCFATAMAGRVMGINPFDQPDVESAKIAARGMLSGDARPEPEPTALADALAQVRSGDQIAICAFVDPGGVSVPGLDAARARLGRTLGVATTLGIGPRFLHSTGQLHKGGPDDQVIVQVVEPATTDLAIPGEAFGFSRLFAAQASGDLQALRAAGRRAHRVRLDELLA